MEMVEIKTDIPVASVEAVDQALLESGATSWNVLEDAIAKRAWLVGIFTSEADALADVAPEEDGHLPGGLALFEKPIHFRRADRGRLQLRAGHFLDVLGEFLRREFLRVVWWRGECKHGGGLAVLDECGGVKRLV